MNIYREALQSEPNNAFAKLGSAQVLVGTFDDAANTYLEPLLSDSTTDDGARAGAWLLGAGTKPQPGSVVALGQRWARSSGRRPLPRPLPRIGRATHGPPGSQPPG